MTSETMGNDEYDDSDTLVGSADQTKSPRTTDPISASTNRPPRATPATNTANSVYLWRTREVQTNPRILVSADGNHPFDCDATKSRSKPEHPITVRAVASDAHTEQSNSERTYSHPSDNPEESEMLTSASNTASARRRNRPIRQFTKPSTTHCGAPLTMPKVNGGTLRKRPSNGTAEMVRPLFTEANKAKMNTEKSPHEYVEDCIEMDSPVGKTIPTCDVYVPGRSTDGQKAQPITPQEKLSRPDSWKKGTGGTELSPEHDSSGTKQQKLDVKIRSTLETGVDRTKTTYEPEKGKMKAAKERGLRTKREER